MLNDEQIERGPAEPGATSNESGAAPETQPVKRERFFFDASKRVRKQKDFDRVYEFRARSYNERLTVCCCPTGSHARLGLSVSRKVGNAVTRARWKRLIREVFRLNYSQLPQGFDYVVIPKRQERVPSFATLSDDVPYLMRRASRRALKIQERRAEEESSQNAGQVAEQASQPESIASEKSAEERG